MEILIFDLGGVLINLNVRRCMQAFEALMGEQNMRAVLGMNNQGEGIPSVSVASKQLMMDYERGLISSDEFIEAVRAYCVPGTTRQQIIDAWMSMLDDLPAERLAFVDEMHAMGCPVYLLSNTNELHFDFINRTYHLDDHFNGFFLSYQLHMSKPEREIFEYVLDALTPFPDKPFPLVRRNALSVTFIDDIEVNRLATERYNWLAFPSIDHYKDALTRDFGF